MVDSNSQTGSSNWLTAPNPSMDVGFDRREPTYRVNGIKISKDCSVIGFRTITEEDEGTTPPAVFSKRQPAPYRLLHYLLTFKNFIHTLQNGR